VSDGVDADNLRPVVDFFQSAAESRSVFEIRNLAFGFTPRILEQEARGVEAKLVFGEIARARDHVAIHVVAVAIAVIKVNGFLWAILKNGFLIGEAALIVDFARFFVRDNAPLKRIVSGDDLLKFFVDLDEHGGIADHVRIKKVNRDSPAYVVGKADVKIRVAAGKSHRHDVAKGGLVDFDGVVIL